MCSNADKELFHRIFHWFIAIPCGDSNMRLISLIFFNHDMIFLCGIKECWAYFSVLASVSGLEVTETKLTKGKQLSLCTATWCFWFMMPFDKYFVGHHLLLLSFSNILIVRRWTPLDCLCNIGRSVCSAAFWHPQGSIYICTNCDHLVGIDFFHWAVQHNTLESKDCACIFPALYYQIL